MKKPFLIICLMTLCWGTADAQFFQNVDDWLKRKQERQPYDTTYIYRPQERWLVRSRSLFSGESVSMFAKDGENVNTLSLKSGLQYKQTFGAGASHISLTAGNRF